MDGNADDFNYTIDEVTCVLVDSSAPDVLEQCRNSNFSDKPRRIPKKRRPRIRRSLENREPEKVCSVGNEEISKEVGWECRKEDISDKEHFICHSCNAVYSLKRTLIFHIKQVHTNSEASFICTYCGLEFRYSHSLSRHVQIKHEPGNVFKCSKCDAIFQSEQDCKAHKIEVHQKKQFTCSICQKVFRHRQNLSRHKKTCHSNANVGENSGFECSVCNRKFLRPDILRRHVKVMHSNRRELYRCEECGVDMGFKNSLYRHIQNIHSQVECATCQKKFSSKSDLLWHLRTDHPSDNSRCGVACVLCDATFPKRSHTVKHLEEDHQVRLERETLWMSVGEFDEWKKNVEKSTISQFVRTHISRSVSGTVTTFTCHRSGILKGRPRKLRRTKLNGSKKVGGLCPAQISVRQSRNDKACAVSYIKTHLGHPVGDEKELGYVFLSREERLRVAEKIAAGVPFERILDDITSPDVGGDRLKLINRQDLVNISLAHKLKKQPFRGNLFEQPAVDVEAFVREYADSILLYKKPDEVVDPRHPSLAADDFVLIIMTELQREMLRSYGNNVVAVDGARAATGCQFVLQSVLVLDEYREAFPAAFAISNRADETVLDIFLTCVREKVGVLRPSTLVTSMQQSCYESWRRIMATPGQRLYCTWHVNQAWLEQLKQVTNKEKQYKLKQKLYDLRLEAYRVPFAEKLQAFLADVDEETRGFVDYFKRRFAGTAAYWANCYRTCRVESFDAVVRHLHGEERNAETLPGMLKALKKYLQQREVDCQIKKIRGKLTPKLKRLRSRHDSIEKCRNFVMIERTKPDEWLVSSFSGQDAVAELYAVQRVERQCDECTLYCEKCDICFHEYRCSCRDSIKKANMCVHIHGLGIFLKSGRKATASEDANVTTSDCDSHSVNADAAATEPTVIKVDSNSADKTVTPVKIHTGPTWAERDCNPEALCHQIRIEDTPVLFESDLSSIDSVGILANPAVPSEVIDPTESDWCFDFEYGSVHITFASDPSDSEVALAPASLQGLDRVEPDAGLMHADWYLNGECDAMSSAAEHKQPSMAGMSNMSDEFEMGKDNLQESILVNPMDSPWCLGSDCGSMYSAAVSESTFMELYPTSGAESIPIAGASQVPKDREHFRDEMLSVLHDAESTEELNNMINKFIDQIT